MNSAMRLSFKEKVAEWRYLWVLWTVHGTYRKNAFTGKCVKHASQMEAKFTFSYISGF